MRDQDTFERVLASLLGNARIGIIHLDWRGRILEANDRARDLLRQGDGLVDRDGLLSALRAADRARLDRLVADALPTSGAAAVSGSMQLTRPSLRPPFVVHVKPVGAQQRAAGAERVAALVLITEPEHRTPIDPTLVSTSLGLTRMQGRIAAWVAEGRTVREIAGLTGPDRRHRPVASACHLPQAGSHGPSRLSAPRAGGGCGRLTCGQGTISTI